VGSEMCIRDRLDRGTVVVAVLVVSLGLVISLYLARIPSLSAQVGQEVAAADTAVHEVQAVVTLNLVH
jgi:hypothetical protein